ncbi:hypothetical protein OEZ86_002682 [Tetradesmus obliquus]|nr:hypothetical protein OEZ86_002682 [Tetradesmus obliquus]
MQKGSLINAFGPPGTEDAFVAVAQVGQNSAGGTKSDNKVQGKDFNSCEDSMAAAEQGCSRFANISTAAATAAPNAASTSPAQDVHAELALLTSLLGRHLHQQQQAAAAATAAAAAAAPAEQQYSARSAPPAPDAADYEDSGYTESPVSAAAAAAAAATSRGGTSTALAAVGGTSSNQGQRARRKNTDTMQKLQALAEVSEDRLAKQEKRMIKNRESAARSRLRRQQHTEALEEQNAGLRAELAALHSQVGMLQARVNELEWQLQPEAAAAANGGPVSERPAKRACP